MDLGIEGRVAIVAGASQGTGRATAIALAREGVDVALVARSKDKLDRVADEVRALGRRAEVVAVDVTDRAALRAGLDRAAGALGSPTILVHAVASLWRPSKLQFSTDEEVDDQLRTELVSAIDLSRIVLPSMMEARFGRIVVLGSLAARTGISGGTLYATTKAALEGLIRGIALDDSRRGVTANLLSLSFIDSERLATRTAGDEAARERLVRATATREIPSPEDVANVVAFLCSARASVITGAVVEVTAGSHLNNLW